MILAEHIPADLKDRIAPEELLTIALRHGVSTRWPASDLR